MNIETMLLEKIEFGYALEIPEDVKKNLTIEEIVNFETNASRIFFRTFVPGKKVREEVKERIIVYPDWWNHFRASHFPKWINRRFPIKCKYEPVTIMHYHLCPHTGINFRDNFAHISFLQGEESATLI